MCYHLVLTTPFHAQETKDGAGILSVTLRALTRVCTGYDDEGKERRERAAVLHVVGGAVAALEQYYTKACARMVLILTLSKRQYRPLHLSRHYTRTAVLSYLSCNSDRRCWTRRCAPCES